MTNEIRPSDTQNINFISPQRPQGFGGWAKKTITNLILLPLKLAGIMNGLIKKLFFHFAQNTLMGATLDSKQNIPERMNHLQTTYQATPVTLVSRDGIALQAMHFPASKTTLSDVEHVTSKCVQPTQDGPTVLLCVGNDHSVFHEKYEELIKAYLARGINVMCFDYRGVGLSGGTFSERGSYRDSEVALEYIEHLGVPKDKILIEGYSMGSGPATDLAANHPNTQLLLRCPFAKTSLIGDKKLEQEHASIPMRFVCRKLVDYVLSYDNCAKIHHVAGSLGIITAPEDKNVEEADCHNAERLIDAYTQGTQKKSVQYQQAAEGHFSQYTKETRLAAALDSFLERIHFTQPIPEGTKKSDSDT